MHEIINALITRHEYTSYLEIGVGKGNTFNRIRCISKYACDPKPAPIIERAFGETVTACWLPSDELFATLAPATRFDIVLIDGLHLCEQVTRDIIGSLKHLRVGGTVLVHDVNPSREEHAGRVPHPGFPAWNGDVWRAWVPVVGYNSKARTIMTGHGLGVWEDISPEHAIVPPAPNNTMAWSFFDANRHALLRGAP